MKVLLVFPPQFTPYAPYLSLPWLSAYLQPQGHKVVQRDLNIETYHLLLREEFLKRSLDRARQEISKLEAEEELPREALVKYRFLSKVVASGDYVVRQVNDARRVYTSEEFYNPDKLIKSHRIIERALRLAVAPWYPARFSLTEFIMGPYSTSEALIEAVNDTQHNPFREIFEQYFLNSILEEEPGLIGISMSGYWQIIPGLTLASLIKEHSDIHVCVGGQSISRWEDVLPQTESLFRLFDSAIVREGEIPLLSLVTALEEGKGLQTVPNLIYRDGDHIAANPVTEMADINSLPVPAFDGLPLDLYLMPKLMLPLYTCRGCYWKKCAFCDHQYGYENYYTCRDMELVKRDITHLARKYNTNLFPLVDEITPPQRIKAFSEMLLSTGLNIKYFIAQRFEEEYTPQLCELLHRGGLTLVIWGFESASQRLLDAMRKGTDVQVNEMVLRNAAEAGIWNFVAVVHGFPSEERAEAEETHQFLLDRSDIIKGVYSNIFTLGKWSPILHELDQFDVTVESIGELGAYYICHPNSGLSYEEAAEAQTELLNRMRQTYPNFEFWNTLDWPHVFLYLLEKGYDEVDSMRIGAETFVEPSDGWENAVVMLRDGVFLVGHLFDCTDVATECVKKGQYHALYDLFADKYFFISRQAKEMLEQGGEGKSLGELISQAGAVIDRPLEEIQAGYIEFAEKLAHSGLVTCKQNGHHS